MYDNGRQRGGGGAAPPWDQATVCEIGSDHGPSSPLRLNQRAHDVAILPTSAGWNWREAGVLVLITLKRPVEGSTPAVMPMYVKITAPTEPAGLALLVGVSVAWILISW